MSPSTLSVVFLLVCVSSCILYSDPVNTKPSVQIARPTAPFARGQKISLMATASDSEGDRLTYAWYVTAGACDAAPAPSRTPDSLQAPPFDFQLPKDPTSTFCVWLRVTDIHGAFAEDQVVVTARNTRPLVMFRVQQPAPNTYGRFDLHSLFRISSADSSDADGDEIASRSWTLKAPPVSTAKLAPCSPTPPFDQVMCFETGNAAGDYVVQLVINDGLENSDTAELRLTVDGDHPACVADVEPAPEASPLVQGPAEPRLFRVKRVIDDGAPLPALQDGVTRVPPTFAWALRQNGGAWSPIVGFEAQSEVTLPAGSFVVGDRVDVRVTVSDGVATHPVPACDPRCPRGCIDTTVWSVEYR